MVRRRSAYAPLEDDIPDLVSPYESLQDGEGSGLMGQATTMLHRPRRQYDYDLPDSAGGGAGAAESAADPMESVAPPPKYQSPDDDPLSPAHTPIARPEESRYDKLTGPGGDAAAKYDGPMDATGDRDWMQDAPEASGAAPHSSGTENATPRSATPITKDELPRTDAPMGQSARSKKWDEVEDLDKRIAKETEKQGSLGSFFLGLAGGPHVSSMGQAYINNLRQQRAAKANEATYEDNRRGQEPIGRAYRSLDEHGNSVWMQSTKGGGTRVLGPADEDPRVTAAKLKADLANRKSVNLHQGQVDAQGRLHYVDPETGDERISAEKTTVEGARSGESPYGPLPGVEGEKPYTYPVPGAAGMDEEKLRAATAEKVANIRAAAIRDAAKERAAGRGATSQEGQPLKLVDAGRVKKAIAEEAAATRADIQRDPAKKAAMMKTAEEKVYGDFGVHRDEKGRLVYGGGAKKKTKGAVPPPPPGFEAVGP